VELPPELLVQKQHSVVLHQVAASNGLLFPRVSVNMWKETKYPNKVNLQHLVGGRFILEKIVVEGKAPVYMSDANTGMVRHAFHNQKLGVNRYEMKLGTPLDYPMVITYDTGLRGVWFTLRAGSGQIHILKVA
jgi:hypothetical protein